MAWELYQATLSPEDRRELTHFIQHVEAQDLDYDGERPPQEGWDEMTRWDFGDQEPLRLEGGDGR